MVKTGCPRAFRSHNRREDCSPGRTKKYLGLKANGTGKKTQGDRGQSEWCYYGREQGWHGEETTLSETLPILCFIARSGDQEVGLAYSRIGF